jgi:hypothetical protein
MMPFLLVFLGQLAGAAHRARGDVAGDITMQRLVKITGAWFHYL